MEGQAKPSKGQVAILVILAIVAYALYIALGNPGGESVIPERTRPTSPLVIPPSALAAYRLSWDSEDVADWPVSEKLAELSDLAYLPAVDVKGGMMKKDFTKVTPVYFESLAAFVLEAEDVLVIVFRGTQVTADWYFNLKAIGLDTLHGTIHYGFAKGYEGLSSEILQAVRNSKHKHLWLTGHSLGGALALTCAYELIEKNVPISGIVTFGQPMVARRGLADYLDNKLLGKFAHIVNESDIVPRVPPTFTHCGSLVWFTCGEIKRSKPKRQVFGAAQGHGKIIDEDVELRPLTEAEFEASKQKVRESQIPKKLPNGELVFEGNLPFLADHGMEEYLTKVRKMVRKLIVPPIDEEPIRYDHTVEITAVSLVGVTLEKAKVLELRIKDPPLPEMVRNVTVETGNAVTYLGTRTQPEKTETGQVIYGSGWYCVYVKVNEGGSLVVNFEKGESRYQRKVQITLKSNLAPFPSRGM